jgi:alcohol dehydrogenase
MPTRILFGWGNNFTFPRLSIVDPELMVSVPPKMTAYTGMDAFFHSVETYLAASDHLALGAVGLITKYLPIAVKDGTNMEARTKLAWANTEAGMCESLSYCISHYSMEHAVVAYYPEIAHGSGLTMLSISYFRYLAERNPARFPDLARAMGEDVDSLPEKEKLMAFITGLKKLIQNIGLKEEKLADFNIEKKDLRAFEENSTYATGSLFDITPVKLTLDDVVAIFENAYA